MSNNREREREGGRGERERRVAGGGRGGEGKTERGQTGKQADVAGKRGDDGSKKQTLHPCVNSQANKKY